MGRKNQRAGKGWGNPAIAGVILVDSKKIEFSVQLRARSGPNVYRRIRPCIIGRRGPFPFQCRADAASVSPIVVSPVHTDIQSGREGETAFFCKISATSGCRFKNRHPSACVHQVFFRWLIAGFAYFPTGFNLAFSIQINFPVDVEWKFQAKFLAGKDRTAFRHLIARKTFLDEVEGVRKGPFVFAVHPYHAIGVNRVGRDGHIRVKEFRGRAVFRDGLKRQFISRLHACDVKVDAFCFNIDPIIIEFAVNGMKNADCCRRKIFPVHFRFEKHLKGACRKVPHFKTRPGDENRVFDPFEVVKHNAFGNADFDFADVRVGGGSGVGDGQRDFFGVLAVGQCDAFAVGNVAFRLDG